MIKRRALAVGLALSAVLVGCSGADVGPPTTQPPAAPTTADDSAVTTPTPANTTTVESPAPTTTAPAPVSYEFTVPVGPGGIEYQLGGKELETVGPTQLAAVNGVVYIADPVGNMLWMVDNNGHRAVDLIELDILNVTALTASAESLFAVEVSFGPVRQRLHTLSLSGELETSMDLPAGAQLEDGLSDVLVEDRHNPTIVIAGGASYTDPIGGSTRQSVLIGGHTVTQIGAEIDIDGVAIGADLNGRLGGLRLLGGSTDSTVLVREEVLSTAPIIEVLVSVEWYSDGVLVGSALVPIDEQTVSGPPGLTVTPEGRVLMLLAQDDAVRTVELVPSPGRITGTS